MDRKPADVVLLKFAEAFNSTYHGFLLAKFESFGLHGAFLGTLSFVELYKKVLYATVWSEIVLSESTVSKFGKIFIFPIYCLINFSRSLYEI